MAREIVIKTTGEYPILFLSTNRDDTFTATVRFGDATINGREYVRLEASQLHISADGATIQGGRVDASGDYEKPITHSAYNATRDAAKQVIRERIAAEPGYLASVKATSLAARRARLVAAIEQAEADLARFDAHPSLDANGW